MNNRLYIERLFGYSGGRFNDVSAQAPLPFSFLYEGVSSRIFEKDMIWTVEINSIEPFIRRYHAETMIPGSNILITMECKSYLDTPGADWTIYFTNIGRSASGILSEIRSLDLFEKLPGDCKSIMLHMLRGCNNRADDWEPYSQSISPNADDPVVFTFGPFGGKSSCGASPFFNIDCGGFGLICAIGWTGQWEAAVSYGAEKRCSVSAGMKHCHFILNAGEKVRSPRILIMDWYGKTEDAYNDFRRIMFSHIMPKVDGKVPYPPIAHLTNAFDKDPNNGLAKDVYTHFSAVTNVGFEVLWLDAYYHKGGFPWGMGNYGFPAERIVDEERYPDGIRPISEFAHENGAEFLLWLEPERVAEGTLLTGEHPEWLVSNLPDDDGSVKAKHFMFNLGIPEACDFMTAFLSESIEKFGVDILRIDYNYHPLSYWLANDIRIGGGSRDGISEIKYIEGLYQMWDTLLDRFPRLRIDNCASGGMRIDLEMCSRSYPLWRTDGTIGPLFDHDYDQAALQNQLMSLGLNRYVPFSTSGMMGADPYYFRSGFNAGISFAEDCRVPGYPMEMLKAGISEGVRIRDYFRGNYYAMTPNAGTSPENWCVMQYSLTAENMGVVMAFRRHESPYSKFVCNLREIDPGAEYMVNISKHYKCDEALRMTGAALQKLELTLMECPASILVEYKKSRK